MEQKYKLFRCEFIRVGLKYIIGKDRRGRKYKIIKNEATKNFKVGGDEYFYATKETTGLLFNKPVLTPIKYEEYLELINKSKEYRDKVK